MYFPVISISLVFISIFNQRIYIDQNIWRICVVLLTLVWITVYGLNNWEMNKLTLAWFTILMQFNITFTMYKDKQQIENR